MRLGPDQIKWVALRFHHHLQDQRAAINRLNVYPVPDGDTGTNLVLTMGSVVTALEGTQTMPEVAQALGDGSLLGARGNSGIILSQILRAFAAVLREGELAGSEVFAEALRQASEAAYRAVQRPVEGTMLTVMRVAGETASGLDGADLTTLLGEVYRASVEALERTPQQLPVLEKAGVVDAGGAGLVLLLAALAEAASGQPVDLPERLLAAPAELSALEHLSSPEAELRFEVMLLLEAEDAAVQRLRERWAELGGSVAVVGGEGSWSCHLHTDEIGPAIEAAIEAGRPSRLRVADLRDESHPLVPHVHGPAFEPRMEASVAPVGVVAVVAGTGMVELFRELGCQGVVVGGQSLNPSVQSILDVVERVPAPRVVLLPNNPNVIAVAEQVDSICTKQVEVVPTRNLQQGVAAMLGYSFAGEDLAQTAEDMAAAASSIVTGEVTRAVRDATVDFGRVTKGEWLGIADGTIVVSDPDLTVALRGLLAAVFPSFGVELVTLYLGEGAQPAATKGVEAWLAEIHPEVTVKTIEGGQPRYPYLVAVE